MTVFPSPDNFEVPREMINKNILIEKDNNIKLKLLTSIERKERNNSSLSESDLIHEALTAYFENPNITMKMLKAAGFVDPIVPINAAL